MRVHLAALAGDQLMLSLLHPPIDLKLENEII